MGPPNGREIATVFRASQPKPEQRGPHHAVPKNGPFFGLDFGASKTKENKGRAHGAESARNQLTSDRPIEQKKSNGSRLSSPIKPTVKKASNLSIKWRDTLAGTRPSRETTNSATTEPFSSSFSSTKKPKELKFKVHNRGPSHQKLTAEKENCRAEMLQTPARTEEQKPGKSQKQNNASTEAHKRAE